VLWILLIEELVLASSIAAGTYSIPITALTLEAIKLAMVPAPV
jgi:hypothetical protein